MPKMNLYLVLALALGAATPAPVAPPTTHVVTKRSERAAACVVGAHSVRPSAARTAGRRCRPLRWSVTEQTLTGAATPRAPAAA